MFGLVIVDGNNALFKKFQFNSRRRMMCIFLVDYSERLFGVKSKRQMFVLLYFIKSQSFLF